MNHVEVCGIGNDPAGLPINVISGGIIMYQSIQAIEKLRKEKVEILQSVYSERTIKAVYQKQTLLNSMSINIYTDAVSAIVDTIEKDGAGKRVIPRISGRLEELKFKSVPAESVIDDAYNRSINDAQNGRDSQYSYHAGNRAADTPRQGSVVKIKGKGLPLFLAALIAQGIAVPILINGFPVFVKVLGNIANGVIMSVEILKYYQYQKKKSAGGNASSDPKSTPGSVEVRDPDSAREDMKRRAIDQIYRDNLGILNLWFDHFVEITAQEIGAELEKKENKP